jgi:Tfp pilus tip-associated adhesin PilY1
LSTSGNIENLSSILLCIVEDESNNYFPYITQNANGQWNAVVGIGPSSINRPLKFTLILATATQSAVDEIHSRQINQDYYNNYGLGPKLPSGIVELARTGIVRAS